jgi:transcriptional regulator with XRE-family HTH domain
MTSNTDRIATLVRAEMKQQGKTQVELADLLGVTQQSVSRRLTGETPFTVYDLTVLSSYLNIPVADFLASA